ncbi:MAG: GldG family protein [Gorillibacterium sp.]|nr:GldG family protein [Gorillibacterium sp.]
MKKWIRGTNAIVRIAAVIGIFILLTVFLHTVKGFQWDLTASKKFTLADQTITVLKDLDKDVHVIAFTNSSMEYYNRQISDLLQEYGKRNGKLTFKEVDPKKQPSLATQYKVEQYGTIVFESGDKSKTLTFDDVFSTDADQTTLSFTGEEKFTQAIMGLTSDAVKKAYFLTGHGELTTSDVPAFMAGLTSENYTVSDLNLTRDAKIPEDAAELFVLSPQQDLSDAEAKLVQDYAKGDGKLVFSIGLAEKMDTWKNWDATLALLGVKNTHALAVSNKESLSTDPLTIIPEYGTHDITTKLADQDRLTILPAALVLQKDETQTDYTLSTLLETTASSYAKTNLNELLSKEVTTNDLTKAEGDLEGPLDLAYAIADKEGKPKAIVIGNGIFLQDQYFAEQGNKDFTLNSTAWLQGEQSSLTIRPREEAQMQQVFLTTGQTNYIFIATIVVIPALFLIVGGVIWWRRRRG